MPLADAPSTGAATQDHRYRTGGFSPAGSLDGTRAFHTATLLPDGRVLVVGGSGDEGSLAQAEVWEPQEPSTTE